MAMVSDNEQTIRQFRIAAVHADHAAVRAFATSSLPVLEQHSQHAKMMLQQMKAAAMGSQGGVMVHRYPVKGLSCPTYY